MNYVLVLLCFVLVTYSFAETVYVRSNANLVESVAPEPFTVNAEIKQLLNNNAPIHPEYGVKYLTRGIAKLILGLNGAEAQRVIDALEEDGVIKTYEERYAEQYPSNADLP